MQAPEQVIRSTVFHLTFAGRQKGIWLCKEWYFNPFIKKRIFQIHIFAATDPGETWFISAHTHVLGSAAYQAPGTETREPLEVKGSYLRTWGSIRYHPSCLHRGVLGALCFNFFFF